MRIGKADRYYLIFHDLAPHLEDAYAKLGQLVQQEHFYEIIYISNPFAFPALSYNTDLWKNDYKNYWPRPGWDRGVPA